MTTNDYIKYMTEEVVKRIDEPRAVTKQRKQQRRLEKEPSMSKWFGVVPMAVTLWVRKILKRS